MPLSQKDKQQFTAEMGNTFGAPTLSDDESLAFVKKINTDKARIFSKSFHFAKFAKSDDALKAFLKKFKGALDVLQNVLYNLHDKLSEDMLHYILSLVSGLNRQFLLRYLAICENSTWELMYPLIDEACTSIIGLDRLRNMFMSEGEIKIQISAKVMVATGIMNNINKKDKFSHTIIYFLTQKRNQVVIPYLKLLPDHESSLLYQATKDETFMPKILKSIFLRKDK